MNKTPTKQLTYTASLYAALGSIIIHSAKWSDIFLCPSQTTRSCACLGVWSWKRTLMQCTSIVLITAHMHMYTRHNTVQYKQGHHNKAAWAELQEVNSPTLWRQQEGRSICLICFSQRCSYGKLKGELVLDKPDLRHRDKTVHWSYCKWHPELTVWESC